MEIYKFLSYKNSTFYSIIIIGICTTEDHQRKDKNYKTFCRNIFDVEKTKVKMFLISIEFILVISNNLLLRIWSLTIFSCTLGFWYCYLIFYFWLLINTPSNIHSQRLIGIWEWYFSSTFSINLWESTFEPFISWDIRSIPISE